MCFFLRSFFCSLLLLGISVSSVSAGQLFPPSYPSVCLNGGGSLTWTRNRATGDLFLSCQKTALSNTSGSIICPNGKVLTGIQNGAAICVDYATIAAAGNGSLPTTTTTTTEEEASTTATEDEEDSTESSAPAGFGSVKGYLSCSQPLRAIIPVHGSSITYTITNKATPNPTNPQATGIHPRCDKYENHKMLCSKTDYTMTAKLEKSSIFPAAASAPTSGTLTCHIYIDQVYSDSVATAHGVLTATLSDGTTVRGSLPFTFLNAGRITTGTVVHLRGD